MGSFSSAPAVDVHRPHLRVHAINIYVRDQEQSLRFYRDQLGFDLAFDAQLQTGDRWVAVAPPDGSALLDADRAQARIPRLSAHRTIHRDRLCYRGCPRQVRRVAPPRRSLPICAAPEAGEVPPPDRQPADRVSKRSNQTWGGVFTHFKDLDGNSFALVGFDEVTREIEVQRRALEEQREAERRAAQELEIAKDVQARLFPQIPLPVKTLECAGTCIQARQVGGDYFDFLDLGEGCFGLVTGDVAGKGIAAALLMANLQANLQIQCGMGLDQPRALLRSVNQVFHKNTNESAYATLFFAKYDDEQRRLRYANCGHLPPLLLRRDNSLDRLESTGTVLGLFREWDCVVEERYLCAGDVLAIYTDGITEAFNDTDEEFGEDRLVDSLRRHRHLPAQGIISAVVEEVRRFSAYEQHDDITLTIAKCR